MSVLQMAQDRIIVCKVAKHACSQTYQTRCQGEAPAKRSHVQILGMELGIAGRGGMGAGPEE